MSAISQALLGDLQALFYYVLENINGQKEIFIPE